MDSIGEILQRKNLDVPDEVVAVQRYVLDNYGYKPKVINKANTITVYMRSATEVSSLRMRYRELRQSCSLKNKLYIRVA